jgi:hypothetical protein
MAVEDTRTLPVFKAFPLNLSWGATIQPHIHTFCIKISVLILSLPAPFICHVLSSTDIVGSRLHAYLVSYKCEAFWVVTACSIENTRRFGSTCRLFQGLNQLRYSVPALCKHTELLSYSKRQLNTHIVSYIF